MTSSSDTGGFFARAGGSLIGASCWYARVEQEADGQLVDHVRRAANVISLRMSEDGSRETVDPQALQLVGDVGLRRSLVDQYGALGHLDERGVALTHVEERDAKPGGRRRNAVRRLQSPADEHERE